MTKTTMALKHAVHPSIRQQKKGKPKTRAELIMAQLLRDGLMPFRVRLTEYGAIALAQFLRDLNTGWGGSGALAPPDYLREGLSGLTLDGQPTTPTDAQIRAQQTLELLHDWQRALVEELLLAREKANYTLTKLGYQLYFATDDIQARERATTRIQSLADSILEHHPQMAGWRVVADEAQRIKREQKKACLDRVPIPS